MKWIKEDYWITDDKDRVDLDYIAASLQTTYWAKERPKALIEKSIENSFFLTLFKGERPIGFARIVSDCAVFAWLCDVFVDPDFRGGGLGKWLVQCALEHDSMHVKINLLATKDAHGLYEKFSFERKECMVRYNKADSA
ncbi:MAG: GNAT family N-acetyltransferase [Candidatus Omnitrophota bacterium]